MQIGAARNRRKIYIPLMNLSSSCSLVETEVLWRCLACDTVFESGVADDLRGARRCPQCGLTESVAAESVKADEIVIRRTTRFR